MSRDRSSRPPCQPAVRVPTTMHRPASSTLTRTFAVSGLPAALWVRVDTWNGEATSTAAGSTRKCAPGFRNDPWRPRLASREWRSASLPARISPGHAPRRYGATGGTPRAMTAADVERAPTRPWSARPPSRLSGRFCSSTSWMLPRPSTSRGGSALPRYGSSPTPATPGARCTRQTAATSQPSASDVDPASSLRGPNGPSARAYSPCPPRLCG